VSIVGTRAVFGDFLLVAVALLVVVSDAQPAVAGIAVLDSLGETYRDSRMPI
jgi:hypothetical protein